MPTQYEVLDRQVHYLLAGVEQDQLPANFPIARWEEQLARYATYRYWFSGDVWEETIGGQTATGDAPLRFPLQINIIKTVCEKHAAALFGEAPDTSDPLVKMRADPMPDPGSTDITEEDREVARVAQDFVNRVWYDSDGRALLDEASIIAEYMGGAVFQVRWAGLPDIPWSVNKPTGTIRIEHVLPDFFLPVWAGNRWDLLEAFVVYRLPGRQAVLSYGVDVGQKDYVIYVEHWTQRDITITIDDQPIAYTFPNGTSIIYDHVQNPFGFVPFVYIPHLRQGGFYGLSHVDDLKGLSREYNARQADLGDAMNETAHRERYVRNIGSQVRMLDLGSGRIAFNLGLPAPGSPEPDAWVEDPPNFSAGLTNFPQELWVQILRTAHLSPVAFGEDEGSQRSALTLAFRMYPLTSHTRRVRNYWTTGLVRLARMILAMARVKGVGGITDAHLTHVRFSVDWPPIVPRDREQEVNENILLIQTGALSPETALEKLAAVPDPAEEIERVLEYKERLAELETLGAPGKTQQQGPPTDVEAPIASTIVEE